MCNNTCNCNNQNNLAEILEEALEEFFSEHPCFFRNCTDVANDFAIAELLNRRYPCYNRSQFCGL